MDTQPTDEVKAKLGHTATFAWLGTGVLLFLIDGGVKKLLSLQALLFLGVGMFVAAVLVGFVSYKIFLNLAYKNGISAGPENARQAVIKNYHLSQGIACVLGPLFTLWCYASFFWY